MHLDDWGHLAELEHLIRRCRCEQMHGPSDDPGPTGLVTGPQPGAIVAMKVLIEGQAIAPVRILLEFLAAAINRTSALLVFEEDVCQPASDLLGHLVEIHVSAGSGRTFHHEIVAEIGVVLQQGANNEPVDRHPDRPPPIGVAAEHARIRFGGQIRDAVFLAAD